MEWLAEEVGRVLDAGLTASYLPLVAVCAFGFTALTVASRLLCRALWPAYRTWPAATRADWDVRVVSTLFSTGICVASLLLLDHPDVVGDPLYAVHPPTQTLSAVATGYFLWDMGVCLFYWDVYDASFAAHGAACFLVYLFSLRPFLTRFSPAYLLFEMSTVPLNLNWFLQTVGLADSWVRRANGVLLLATYFGVRVGFGLYQSVRFFQLVLGEAGRSAPVLLIAYYALANVFLNGLNVVWFTKMVRVATRAFAGTAPSRDLTKEGHGRASPPPPPPTAKGKQA
jgi:hypothetical protein